MVIDEEKVLSLTRITKRNNVVKIQESDHNTIVMEFNLRPKTKPYKNLRTETFNFKDKEAQKLFKQPPKILNL